MAWATPLVPGTGVDRAHLLAEHRAACAELRRLRTRLAAVNDYVTLLQADLDDMADEGRNDAPAAADVALELRTLLDLED